MIRPRLTITHATGRVVRPVLGVIAVTAAAAACLGVTHSAADGNHWGAPAVVHSVHVDGIIWE